MKFSLCIQNYFVYSLGKHKTIHKMNERNQARLRLMSIFLTNKGLSVNDFYAVSIQYAIQLQGNYSEKIASKLVGYCPDISARGFLRFKISKNIQITLTN
jgi:hypothetical protein